MSLSMSKLFAFIERYYGIFVTSLVTKKLDKNAIVTLNDGQEVDYDIEF